MIIRVLLLLICFGTTGSTAMMPARSVTITTTAFQSPHPFSSCSKPQHPFAASRNNGRRRRQEPAEKTLRIQSSRHHMVAASSPEYKGQEELQNGDDLQRAIIDTEVKSSSSSSRREFMQATTTSLSAATTAACMAFAGNAHVAAAATAEAANDNVYKPAIRPTAYRVDSTIPPTLLPLQGARQEVQILQSLGRGSGTNKEAVFVDTINLNNMLNKAVFGTINQVSSLIPGASSSSSLNSNNQQPNTKGPGYASFVCLGVPMEPSSVDIELAVTLLQTMFQVRNNKGGAGSGSNTALGLAFLPYSTQSVLDEYVSGTRSQADLFQTLMQASVAESTLQLYAPLFELAKSSQISLLAMAPEAQDLEALRQKGGGLQNVNPERRAQYVVDPQGFIALSKDERFEMYTDRSLLKDFYNDNNANNANDKSSKTAASSSSSVGNFYAERILVHEAGATAMARFAATHNNPSSSSTEAPLVAMVAPINDVRYLNGMNGRIPRICQTFNAQSVVTKNAVSTILINPTASDTLSKTRHLRLEIGTGPETLDYQTKIADYLWFSSSPKVNLIPRLMDYNY